VEKVNSNVYRSNNAVDRYSVYYLRREEKYLIPKYFQNGSSVLDLACGAGRTTLCLFEMGYKTKGVDLSDALIGAAEKRFPYLDFEEGNYCNIQEENESYGNILISNNGLDYAFPENECEKAFSECFRVLKKGGHFIFSSHNIKYIHGALLPWNEHKLFLLKNSFNAFLNKKYIFERHTGLWTFYGSPKYIIKQAENHGFKLKGTSGNSTQKDKIVIKYFS
jgi:ubiquinone/menaquinone biosynthesis C-methylase UbiE